MKFWNLIEGMIILSTTCACTSFETLYLSKYQYKSSPIAHIDHICIVSNVKQHKHIDNVKKEQINNINTDKSDMLCVTEKVKCTRYMKTNN